MDRQFYKNSGLQKSPPILVLNKEDTDRLLNQYHYLGAVKGMIYSWGHAEGCCVFTNCRSRIYEESMKAKNVRAIELARMVGAPNHKWSMSSLMSLCMKELKKLDEYDLVVTYADPFAGHDGMTYKAAGWKFDGLICKDGHPLLFIDGKRVAPRTLYDRHGTQSVPKIKEIYGSRLETKEKPAKKRFIKYL